MTFDLVLRGGLIVDGTGGPPRHADVGVVDGAVAALADLSSAEAAEVIDVAGRAVAPGFIDAHTHSDLAALLPVQWQAIPLAPLRQGVTTEVCGNCGESPFPTTPAHRAASNSNTDAVFQVGIGALESFDAYAQTMSVRPLPTNQAPMVGHGSLRGAAMGFDNRPADAAEFATMLRLAREAFEQGAFGLSSGLIYAPGLYAPEQELVELAMVAAAFGAPYVSHMRDEADLVADAIEEALRIGRTSGAGVHISHHKLAGRRNWGRSAETLGMLDRARSGGQDVTVDVYPYTAGSTSLHALLPPWTNDGGIAAVLARVAGADVRARIDRDLRTGLPGWQNIAGPAGWDNVVIAGSPAAPEIEGLSVAELSDATGRAPVDTVCDIIIADGARTVVVLHMMSDDDVGSIRDWPAAMVGSDGVPVPGKPHPRLAGTFARAVRAPNPADPWAGLPERVRRMTSMPAERYRIPRRGTLAVGAAADIVVFDPATVTDRATYVDPLLPPEGVEHVFVAGVAGIRTGRPTGSYAGQVLRAR